nr:MAG TPA: hypothetical protein [Bacteriophage sp.]
MDENRFYSLDIHTQYLLQDSVRRDSFKNITTIEGVQWLLFTFYHWGIQYLTYDEKKGLQLFHSKPVYDTKSKSWYGGVITKSVENTDGSGNSGNNGVGEGNGNTINSGVDSRGISNITRDINSEVNTISDTTIADGREGVNHVTGASNVTGASDSMVNRGILNQGEPNRTDSMAIPNHMDVRYTVPVEEYVDTINKSKSLSFYIHSLISSVFPFNDGTGIELVTQAINEDATNKQKLHDGSIVEVSNNGVTWFKRYFKEIVPNMSTKFCVYGGGRTKDTIRDMADVEYYQYIRYNDVDTNSGNTCSNTCSNTCGNTCGNCHTVKYEAIRNTVDGRVVFSDRDSLK